MIENFFGFPDGIGAGPSSLGSGPPGGALRGGVDLLRGVVGARPVLPVLSRWLIEGGFEVTAEAVIAAKRDGVAPAGGGGH